MQSLFAFWMLLAGSPMLTPPERATTFKRQQLYAYIVVVYARPRGPSLKVISQVFGYCVSPGRDPVRGLKANAIEEVTRYEGQGEIKRPAGSSREITFNGGNSSADQAERSRKGWFGANTSTYHTTFDSIYYPEKDCRW